MRVLGIDPGTAIVGYSIVDYENNQIKLIDYGCIYTEKDTPMPLRIEQIFLRLETLINLHKPHHLAIEELFFFKNQKTIITVAQARGVILLRAQMSGLEIFGYTPLQVKVGMTGYGRAPKKQVQEMVRSILNLDKIPQPDDAADAIAIAINHINTVRGVGGIVSNARSNKSDYPNLKIETTKGNNVISVEDYKKMLSKGKKK